MWWLQNAGGEYVYVKAIQNHSYFRTEFVLLKSILEHSWA